MTGCFTHQTVIGQWKLPWSPDFLLSTWHLRDYSNMTLVSIDDLNKGTKVVMGVIPLKRVHLCTLFTPKECISVHQNYILVPFVKVPPQWRLLYLFVWVCNVSNSVQASAPRPGAWPPQSRARHLVLGSDPSEADPAHCNTGTAGDHGAVCFSWSPAVCLFAKWHLSETCCTNIFMLICTSDFMPWVFEMWCNVM